MNSVADGAGCLRASIGFSEHDKAKHPNTRENLRQIEKISDFRRENVYKAMVSKRFSAIQETK
jgi:hypothetical protein